MNDFVPNPVEVPKMLDEFQQAMSESRPMVVEQIGLGHCTEAMLLRFDKIAERLPRLVTDWGTDSTAALPDSAWATRMWDWSQDWMEFCEAMAVLSPD
jgi:hypothetical protein